MLLNMKKYALVVLILLLVSVIIVANCKMQFENLSQLPVIIDQCMTTDGSIYMLSDDKKGNVLLRKISYDGSLLMVKLLKNTDGPFFIKTRIIGDYNGSVYILRYTYNMQTFKGERTRIECYKPGYSEPQVLYDEINIPEVFISRKIWDGVICIGQELESGFDVTRIYPDGSRDVRTVYGWPEDTTTFFTDKSGNIFAVTVYSQIYKYNGEWELLHDEANAYISLFMDDDENIYIFNSNTGTSSMIVSLNTKTGETNTIHELDKIRSVNIENEEMWTAIDDNFNFSVRHGGDIHYIESLHVPLPYIFEKEFVISVILQCFAAIGIVLLIYMFCHLRRIPMLVKQMLLIIPVFTIGGIVLNIVFSNYMTETIFDKTYAMLQSNALGRAESYLYMDDSYDSAGEFEEQNISFWYFSVQNNMVYIDQCGHLYVNMPAYFTHKQPDGLEIQKMIDTKRPQRYEKYSDTGESTWFCALAPILDENNQVIGYVEAGILSAQLNIIVTNSVKLISRMITVILSSGLIIYVFGLFISLRHLKKLKKGTIAISEGNYAYRVDIRSRDELGDIGAIFNFMAEKVKKAISDIEETNRSFSRFVPFEMFFAFNKEKVTDVRLGDCTEIKVSLLQLCTHEFEQYLKEDLFELLNNFYGQIMPKIIESNGMIERYSEDRLVALYKTNPENALRTAIRIFEGLARAEKNIIQCTAVIGYSKVMVGIIGISERLEATVVSGYVYETEQIGIMGKRLGCRIIMTEEAKVELGPCVEAYKYRFLGYVCVQNNFKAVYDVFDGDFSDLRFEKHTTKSLFEESVNLYYDGNFYEARKGFIEVIKRSPQDICAKEYLKLSDHLHNNEGKVIPLLTLQSI